MATFEDFEMGKGWWFYFVLRYAAGDEEFKKEFLNELRHLALHEGSDNIPNGKNDSIKKRIPVSRL